MFRFAALVLALSFTAAAVENPKTLAIGSPAPDFSLPGVDGKTYTLKDFASAKILIVMFTSNHCPSAQAYEERIKKIVTDYKDKGVQLVGINPNSPRGLRLDELGYTDLGDTFDEMKIRAKDHAFNFPYLDDGDKQEVARAYGCKVTPHAFVFDAERKLQYVGRIDDNEREQLSKVPDLRNALDELLAGKEVTVKETRAGGCSTKWAGKEEDVKKFMDRLAAEPVTLDDANEETLKDLNKASGKIRLVNFWATSCGPCVAEFSELITINRMYRNRAFEMITVSANFPDEKKEALAFLQKKQSSGKNLIFSGTDKYKQMAAFDKDWDASLPYTVLFDAEGKVLNKWNNQIEPLEVKRAIVKALQELNKGYVMDAPKPKKQ
jgi:peroxiredoxin